MPANRAPLPHIPVAVSQAAQPEGQNILVEPIFCPLPPPEQLPESVHVVPFGEIGYLFPYVHVMSSRPARSSAHIRPRCLPDRVQGSPVHRQSPV